MARDFNLGLGEAAAIALGLQQKAELVSLKKSRVTVLTKSRYIRR